MEEGTKEQRFERGHEGKFSLEKSQGHAMLQEESALRN
jgi:hypothetical protein